MPTFARTPFINKFPFKFGPFFKKARFKGKKTELATRLTALFPPLDLDFFKR